MELMILCFFIGVVAAVVPAGVIAWYGKSTDGDGKSDYEGVVRHTAEEMIQVLQVMRLGASRYEREVLNEIIDLLGKGEDKDGNRRSGSDDA